MEVEHDTAGNRFRIALPQGDAVLRYSRPDAGIMDIESTFVPSTARGQGYGGQLVEAALRFAEGEALSVIPSCWYVRTWVDSHPRYASLLQE